MKMEIKEVAKLNWIWYSGAYSKEKKKSKVNKKKANDLFVLIKNIFFKNIYIYN